MFALFSPIWQNVVAIGTHMAESPVRGQHVLRHKFVTNIAGFLVATDLWTVMGDMVSVNSK